MKQFKPLFRVADFKSFTRAAEAMGSTQSAVSLKLKRLEERLGRKLIERTPRRVRISADGELFLDAARELIAAQERAFATFVAERRRLSIGISHHVVGSELPVILKRMGEQDPALVVEIRVAGSEDVLRDFDGGGLDAAIVLRHDTARRDGEVLMKERFGWFAALDWSARPGEPMRIATQSATCGLRAVSASCARCGGHCMDRGFCRRRCRDHRRRGRRRPCGRRSHATLCAVRHGRRRRKTFIARAAAY